MSDSKKTGKIRISVLLLRIVLVFWNQTLFAKLYCHPSHLHFEIVENLNCLSHPELTDNNYILEKAKSLGKYKKVSFKIE